MFANRQDFINSIGVAPREVFITSSATVTTYAMDVADQILRITTDAANAITVTLPPVDLAKGLMYSIALITDGGVNVTLTDDGSDTIWADLTLADVNDRVLVMSDGRYWHLVANTGAA